MQGWFCKKDWSDQRCRRGLISQIGSFLFSDASDCFLINLKKCVLFLGRFRRRSRLTDFSL